MTNLDYSYQAITAEINKLVAEKTTAIDKVTAALRGVDIPAQLKMRLIDTIHNAYEPQIGRLSDMATVAEWHEYHPPNDERIAELDKQIGELRRKLL